MAFPEVSVWSTMLEQNVHLSTVITPSKVESALNVRRLPLSTRQCTFAEEVRLN